MTVIAIPKFQHLFRVAAGLHPDKDDLKRYSDFLNHKLYDMLLMAEATARANLRDIVQPMDLPITKGLQQCMRQFKKLDSETELVSLLDQMETVPPLDLTLSDEAEAGLPEVAGGLSVALARAVRAMDPGLKTPHAADWERAFRVMDLLI